MPAGLPATEKLEKDGIMSELKKMPLSLGAATLVAGACWSASAQGEVQASDPAALYKAKCVACHGQKAEKKFDSTLPDEQLVEQCD